MYNSGPSSFFSSLSSPPKKQPKLACVSANERAIAVNVYKYIEETITAYPFKAEVIKKTAEIIGTCQFTVF